MHDEISTSSTQNIATTPAPITLTSPSVTTNQLITSVTCEITSVFIGSISQ